MARGKPIIVAGTRRTIPAAQVPRYEKQVEHIEAEWSDAHDAHVRRAAIEAAGRYLSGETDLPEAIGRELAEAKNRYEAATSAARTVVRMAVDDNTSELSLAQRMGINRLTVRKYRGKIDRRWKRN